MGHEDSQDDVQVLAADHACWRQSDLRYCTLLMCMPWTLNRVNCSC